MHKRILASAIVACFLALVASAAYADTWEIDSAHTSVQFSVRHMTISNVRGEFGKVTGTVTSDGTDPKQVQIEATIDASTIDTHQEHRDADLKSPNFLDVAKYPTIVFKSKKIEPAGAGKWEVTGDLTLHGVTKEVTLHVEGPSSQVKDPHGNLHVGAHATTTINRKDFGLTWNRVIETGGLMVGEDVEITIEVEAMKKAASAAGAASGSL
jgi:polyisoprenoid-binding protein YceI